MIAQLVERRTVEVYKVFRWPGVRITLARFGVFCVVCILNYLFQNTYVCN